MAIPSCGWWCVPTWICVFRTWQHCWPFCTWRQRHLSLPPRSPRVRASQCSPRNQSIVTSPISCPPNQSGRPPMVKQKVSTGNTCNDAPTTLAVFLGAHLPSPRSIYTSLNFSVKFKRTSATIQCVTESTLAWRESIFIITTAHISIAHNQHEASAIHRET